MARLWLNDTITDPAVSWQARVIRASIGTTTGLIILAMLAKQPKRGPRFGDTADIQADGFFYTQLSANGRGHKWTCVGSVENVRDNLRRVADKCKLADVDREALFEELRKWIRKDYRARSEN